MKIKALHCFRGVNEFNIFTDYLEKISWKIDKQLLKERVDKHKDNTFINDLKKNFTDRQISIWPLKNEEAITWLDTLTLMKRLMSEIFKKGVNVNELIILMEYPLLYGNYMRTDYLLVYDRLIIVLEFGMFNQDERRSEERYTKKLQESINHRQVIANMISNGINIINYVMIYKPEYNQQNRTSLPINIEYNRAELSELTDFIVKNMRCQDDLSAIKQLEFIYPYK